MISKLKNCDINHSGYVVLPYAYLWVSKVWERDMPNYLRDLAKHQQQLEEIRRRAERFGRPKRGEPKDEESDIEIGGSLAGIGLLAGVFFLAGGVAGSAYYSLQIIGIIGFIIFGLSLIFFIFDRQRKLEKVQKRRKQQVREFHMKKGDPNYWGRGEAYDD